MLVVASVMLTIGCQCNSESDVITLCQLTISTPDGHFYNLASDPSRLGSTGARFHDILLSDSQMSKILHLVKRKHSFSWVVMTAESPYPRSHTVLLWYGSAPSGSDSAMCSLGAVGDAAPILDEIRAHIPESLQPDFLKSLSRMKGTQP